MVTELVSVLVELVLFYRVLLSNVGAGPDFLLGGRDSCRIVRAIPHDLLIADEILGRRFLLVHDLPICQFERLLNVPRDLEKIRSAYLLIRCG